MPPFWKFFYGLGLRISEALNLTLQDIDMDRKLVRVTGKGRKVRYTPCTERTLEAIIAYLPVRVRWAKPGERDWLFIGPRKAAFCPKHAGSGRKTWG